MQLPDFPLLSLLLTIPRGGALVLSVLHRLRHVRQLTLVITVLELLLSLVVLFGYDPSLGAMQGVEDRTWIASLNIRYHVGIDGISVIFLPLTALLTSAVVLASWTAIQQQLRLYCILLLVLESATLGVFCALDLVLFFLFWEMTLIPIYFLMTLWGAGQRRHHVALQYTLLMLSGGVALLLGFILLALDHSAPAASAGLAELSFDYLELLKHPPSPERQNLIFLLLLFGFAVKTPLPPLHGWLPAMALEGPTGLTALLVGLKLGAFGILRFAVPLAPEAAHDHFPLLAGFAVTGILYGALLALRQNNLRRMLGYASISHVGFVVMGIASLNIQGLQGAWLQLANFALVASGLMLLTGFIQHRLGTTDLTAFGGMARTMPRLASFFFILGLASIGVPGTNGFPAENLILIGALQKHVGLGFAALLGVILGAAYFLNYFQQAFWGPVKHPGVQACLDLRPREFTIAAIFSLPVIGIGLWPHFLLNFSRTTLQQWLLHLQ